MPELVSFDYAILRVVPNVAREEFLNAGVLLWCVVQDFLDARVELDEGRLLAFAPDAEVETLREHLQVIPRLCAGGKDAGPIGLLSRKERWHWLVAPRSTVIQLSAVHSGLCHSPQEALGRIFDEAVALPKR